MSDPVEVKINEKVEATSNELAETIKQSMKDSFMEKGEFQGIVDTVKNATIGEVFNHTDCDKDDCPICKMKSNIDGTGYERGVKGGIKLGQKFPTFRFNI